MILIVGLGNPGEKYLYTRHNIGFLVVEKLGKNLTSIEKKWQEDKEVKVKTLKTGDIVLALPQTFMNASGFAVSKLLNFYKLNISQLWVVHDDLDLPLGKIRIKIGGGSAGHHGVESIMRETGKDDFVRFRLGVGRGKMIETKHIDTHLNHHVIEKYVVSKFTNHEEAEVRKLVKHASKAIETALQTGIDKAMNQYN